MLVNHQAPTEAENNQTIEGWPTVSLISGGLWRFAHGSDKFSDLCPHGRGLLSQLTGRPTQGFRIVTRGFSSGVGRIHRSLCMSENSFTAAAVINYIIEG